MCKECECWGEPFALCLVAPPGHFSLVPSAPPDFLCKKCLKCFCKVAGRCEAPTRLKCCEATAKQYRRFTSAKTGYNKFMKKEVSIVLSKGVTNYRRLAQEWFGLTDEQMADMDVHHNPARHQGGRNIPEHLFVYHNTLHAAVHGDDFTKWARKGAASVQNRNTAPGGKVSGPICVENQLGIFNPENKEKVREGAKKCGAKRAQQMAQEGFPGLGSSFEAASLAGKKAAAQRWKCLVTGHISSAGGLARFQKARGIDTSLRERLE